MKWTGQHAVRGRLRERGWRELVAVLFGRRPGVGTARAL